MRVSGERLNGIQEVKSSILSVSTKKSRSSERDFFIQADRLGISSRFSVYIIAEGVYHHTKCAFCRLDDIQSLRFDEIQCFALMISTALP